MYKRMIASPRIPVSRLAVPLRKPLTPGTSFAVMPRTALSAFSPEIMARRSSLRAADLSHSQTLSGTYSLARRARSALSARLESTRPRCENSAVIMGTTIQNRAARQASSPTTVRATASQRLRTARSIRLVRGLSM
jgi:hypothetical protein